MTETNALKLLRCDDARLVDILLGMVNLSWKEERAITLCGRQMLTQCRASEIVGISEDTMQRWYRQGINKVCKVWGGIWWVEKLID